MPIFLRRFGIFPGFFCGGLIAFLSLTAEAQTRPTSRSTVPAPAATQPLPAAPAPLAAPAAASPAVPVVPENAPLDVSPELTATLQKAADAFNASDFEGTLKLLRAIYEKHPEISPPRIILAQWFAKAQLPDAIRVSLEAATEEVPEDPEAYLLLGEISLRQGELTAASLLFERVEKLLQSYAANPQRKKLLLISLYRNSATLAETRKKWDRMEAAIDERIALEGKTAELLRQKAIAAFWQNRDEEAKRFLEQADGLDANLSAGGFPAEAVLSQLYILRGDSAKGKTFLEEALKKYPKSREVLTLSVLMRISEEKLDEARALAEKLLAEDPQSASAKRLLATIALYQEDYPAGEKLFRELIVASPADTAAYNGLALALCEQDDSDKLRLALEYATENVRRESNNGEFLGTLGWVLYKMKNYEQALKILQQAAAAGKVNAQTAYFLARFAFQNGQVDQAKQLLQAALQDNQPFAKRQEAKNLLKELNK